MEVPKPVFYFILLLCVVLLYFVWSNGHPSVSKSQNGVTPPEPQENSTLIILRNRAKAKGFSENIAVKLYELFPDIPAQYVIFENDRGNTCSNVVAAKFTIGNEPIEVEFYKNGNHIETEYEEVPIEKLPEHIKKIVSQKAWFNKLQSYELEINSNGERFYEFEVNALDFDITYNQYGDECGKGKSCINICED